MMKKLFWNAITLSMQNFPRLSLLKVESPYVQFLNVNPCNILGSLHPIKVMKPINKKSDYNPASNRKSDIMMQFITGRDDECNQLNDIYESWRKGSKARVVISGRSGYGKSSLGNWITEKISSNNNIIIWYKIQYLRFILLKYIFFSSSRGSETERRTMFFAFQKILENILATMQKHLNNGELIKILEPNRYKTLENTSNIIFDFIISFDEFFLIFSITAPLNRTDSVASQLTNNSSLYRPSTVGSSKNNLNIVLSIVARFKRNDYTDILDLLIGHRVLNLAVVNLAFPELFSKFSKKDSKIFDKVNIDISDLNAKVSMIVVELFNTLAGCSVDIMISIDDIQVKYCFLVFLIYLKIVN